MEVMARIRASPILVQVQQGEQNKETRSSPAPIKAFVVVSKSNFFYVMHSFRAHKPCE
jgi:hypothetical protein